ncbi:MAG: DMT family transporter [Candidatus Puniceispirillaceae bacterium]
MTKSFVKAAFQKALPWTFLLVMGTAWGLSFSLGKIAVENGAKPFGVAQFQVMFAGIVLLFVNVIRGKSTQNMRDKLGFIFCIAMLGAAIPSVLFYYAAPHVPAGVLSITVALIPLMTYGFSIPLKLETFSVVRAVGLVFGVIAICLIALPENSLPDPATLPWIFIACISALCYAVENIILGFKSALTVGPMRLAMGMNLIAAVTLLPITILTDSYFSPSLPLKTVDYAVIGLGLITVVAYTMFVLSVALFGSVFSSQVGYIVTLTGVFWGMIIFGESPSVWIWLSLCAMIVGLALVTPRKKS